MTNSPDLRGSLRLDGHHGPASRLSRLRAEEMIEKAMEQAEAPSLPRPRKKSFSWPSSALLVPVAAAVPLALLAGAAAYFVSTHHGGVAKVGAEPARPAVVAARAASPDVSTANDGERLAPEAMLEKGNELRAKGEWLAATELYEQTAQQYPSSREAYQAMVAAGLLRIQRLGDAKGGLGLLSSAISLRPSDASSREARWGRIEALRALDDRAEEKRSLVEFVGLYSDGPLPVLARERLARLSQ